MKTTKYLIRVHATTDCWIADIDGDPGRTLLKRNAKQFDRYPGQQMSELVAKYPNRTF